jgi:hypothetical protein
VAARQKENVLGTAVADHALTIALVFLETENALYLMHGALAKRELTNDLRYTTARTIAARPGTTFELDEGNLALCLYDRYTLNFSQLPRRPSLG